MEDTDKREAAKILDEIILKVQGELSQKESDKSANDVLKSIEKDLNTYLTSEGLRYTEENLRAYVVGIKNGHKAIHNEKDFKYKTTEIFMAIASIRNKKAKLKIN